MSKQWYVGMAAGGALFWGINGILSNMLFDRIAISPDWLTTARLLISGAALLLYSLIRRQNIFAIWRQPKNAVLLVSFGLIGVYFAQSNFVRTLYYGNAAVATVLQYMAPYTAKRSQPLHYRNTTFARNWTGQNTPQLTQTIPIRRRFSVDAKSQKYFADGLIGIVWVNWGVFCPVQFRANVVLR